MIMDLSSSFSETNSLDVEGMVEDLGKAGVNFLKSSSKGAYVCWFHWILGIAVLIIVLVSPQVVIILISTAFDFNVILQEIEKSTHLNFNNHYLKCII
jgi:hypothetical protein